MSKFIVTQIDRYNNYVHVELSPVAERDMFSFMPGQYAGISFKDAEGTSPVRCFSLVSSPSRPEQIEFGFRVTGDFTRRFAGLQVGTEVSVQGPFGEFILDDSVENAVLIAGGIGITPFISMLRYAAQLRPGGSLTLLYACREASDFPFIEEVQSIAAQTPNIKAYFFVNELPDAAQNTANTRFYKGPITAQHLKSLTQNNLDKYAYYICGPKRMMEGLSSELVDNGVSPFQVITESFSSDNKQLTYGLTSKQKTYAWSAAVFAVSVFMIMALDVYHVLPRDDAAQATAQTTTQVQGTSTTTPSAVTTTPTITDTSTSTSNNSSTTTTPTTTQTTTPTYYYYQPRSHSS